MPDTLLQDLIQQSTSHASFPTLDQRADEAARLVALTLFPEIYVDHPAGLNRGVPIIYRKIARIIIQAIEEGLV